MPLQKAGLPLVIVQPGLVYGAGDTSAVGVTLRQYLTGRLFATPRGTAYCWAHVDDAAHAHALAMDKGRAGESYIVAGPPHSLVEAFDLALGASDAVMLDGGISAQLLLRDPARAAPLRWPGMRKVPLGLIARTRATATGTRPALPER